MKSIPDTDNEVKILDPFRSGTVLKWTARGEYDFAALKVSNGYWYLTGGAGMYGSAAQTYEELVEILDREDTGNVSLATGWESV